MTQALTRAASRSWQSDETEARHGSIWLVVPAAVLVAAVVAIPSISLTALSFLGEGGFALDNYLRVLTETNTRIIGTTLTIAFLVTGLAISCGYPVALAIVRLRRPWSGICLLFVLVPFWTSALIRTYSWMILLQRRGLINEALLSFGLVDHPLQLVHNHVGVLIGMLHVMMPFAVLPILASLKAIDLSLVQAAGSLGASPFRAFWTVVFPLSLPGVIAAAMFIFTLGFGFYLTPALLGGGKVTTIAMVIHQYAALSPDWGLASALSFVLLVLTAVSMLGFTLLGKASSARSVLP